MFGLMFSVGALGATPVLHGGDAATALATVSRSTGTPQWELRPLGVGDVFGGEGALLLGAAQPPGCSAAPASPTAVRDLVARGEKLLLKQEWSELRGRLAEASALLPCLSAPAEASILSRLFFLDGFAAAEMGDAASASLAFRRAQASQPGMAWDDRVAGAARATFDAVAAAPPPNGTLVLGPGYEAVDQLWIDGGLTLVNHGTVSLAEGVHVVQVLQPTVSTWAVSVRQGSPIALVNAPAARERALAMAGDELGKHVIEAAVERSLGANAELWVLTGTQLWNVGATWASKPVVAEARPVVQKPLGPALIGAGAALTVVGGVGAVAGALDAADHFDAASGESDETYEVRNAWYRDSVTWSAASGVVGGVGVATLIVGFVVGKPATTALAVSPMQGGGALFWSGAF